MQSSTIVPASAEQQTLPGRRKPANSRRRTGLLIAISFVVPALAVLVLLRIWPAIQSILLSFTSWDGIGEPIIVGLKNYYNLATDPVFLQALQNNLLLLLAVPVWVIVPFFVAVALRSRPFGWRVFRLAFFVPNVLSPVIVGIFFSVMLQPQGAVNTLLRSIGLGFITQNWLGDPALALVTLASVVIWSSFGVGVLIFLAALGSVDDDLIAAARLDGAGWWRIQRSVILWEILPAIEFWAVLVLISTFSQLFPLVYTLTRGGPGYATYILDYNIYQEAFKFGNFGYASAIGVVLFALTLVLAVLQIWLFRRADK